MRIGWKFGFILPVLMRRLTPEVRIQGTILCFEASVSKKKPDRSETNNQDRKETNARSQMEPIEQKQEDEKRNKNKTKFHVKRFSATAPWPARCDEMK